MKTPRRITNAAISLTRWIGSPASIIFHTILFVGSFLLAALGLINFDRMLLIVTTIVSLEAIYLAIFIQMSLNLTNQSLEEVEQDIDEIQEDVDEIQKDIDEIQEDVEEISEEEEADEKRKVDQRMTLGEIQANMRKLVEDIERLKNSRT